MALWRAVPLPARILMLDGAPVPTSCLLLGMVTPVVIKLLLPDLTRTGRVVGCVYATGTVGSVVGNFHTGFVLLAYFDTWLIVTAVALTLFGLEVKCLPSPIATTREPSADSSGHPMPRSVAMDSAAISSHPVS